MKHLNEKYLKAYMAKSMYKPIISIYLHTLYKISVTIYGHRSDDEGAEDDIINAQSNSESTDKDQVNNAEIGKIGNKAKRKVQAQEVNNQSSSTNDSEDIPVKKLKLNDSKSNVDKGVEINEDTQINSKKKRKKRKSKASNIDVAQEMKSAHQNFNNQLPSELKDNKPNPFKSTDDKQSSSTNKTTSIAKAFSNSALVKAKSSNPNKPNPFRPNNKRNDNGQANSKQSTRIGSNKIQQKKFRPNSKKFDLSNKVSKNDVNISDERLKAYGINPKKFHKKQKYGKPEN